MSNQPEAPCSSETPNKKPRYPTETNEGTLSSFVFGPEHVELCEPPNGVADPDELYFVCSEKIGSKADTPKELASDDEPVDPK